MSFLASFSASEASDFYFKKLLDNVVTEDQMAGVTEEDARNRV